MRVNRINLLFIFMILSLSAFAQIRAIWVPVWDLSSAGKIDEVIADCNKYGITHIIAQSRYRGDAMYVPNRTSKKFINTEKSSYLLTGNFDPLQYLLDNSGKIKVFAWVTTFVITPHDLKKLDSTHIYFYEPQWVTADFTHAKMDHESYEGAFLDPGLPEVQQYTKNVILDIAENYDVDGIQLDYIRYPDRYFGLNEKARKIYKQETKYEDADSWRSWKEEQINKFVKSTYRDLKKISSDIIVSAAVIANPKDATERFSQNWFSWLEGEYIDYVFPMAYTTSDASLQGIYHIYPKENHKKIVPGLRAWSTDDFYSVDSVNAKIAITLEHNFAGFALYSYSGIVKDGYFDKLKIRK